MVPSILVLGVAASLVAGCGSKAKPQANVSSGADATSDGERSPSCPIEQPAPDRLPGVTDAHRTADYWTKLAEARGLDLDAELLTQEQIARLNASYRVERSGFFSQANLLEAHDPVVLQTKIDERFAWMQSKLSAGEYKRSSQEPAFEKPSAIRFAPELRVALEETQLFCAPTKTGIYDSDATSERINRNTCSAAHAQELIEVLAPWPGNMLLARTATSWGFIDASVKLSPVLSADVAARFANGPYAVLQSDATVGAISLEEHTRLPFAEGQEGAVLVASASGTSQEVLAAGSSTTTKRPFTRRAVLEMALSYLGKPYGFGGLGGGIDCSRLQLDLFGSFGIALPRFSGWQSKAGTYSIDVGGTSDEEKTKIIEQATQDGVVILHLPGHIMLYLGKDADGVPMAIHALSYYLDRCDTGEETSMVVGKVQVGGLELGRGTRKTALIERIDRVMVLGALPSSELRGIAKLRPGAPVDKPSSSACRRLPDRRPFVSPKSPERGQDVRVIATRRKARVPQTITFYDARGRRYEPELVETNGPPSAVIGTVAPKSEGKWTAVLGDGSDAVACTTFKVGRAKSRPDWKKIAKANRKEARAFRRAARERRKRRESDPEPEVDPNDPAAVAAALVSAKPVWKARQSWSPI